jgi:hypothetical protein
MVLAGPILAVGKPLNGYDLVFAAASLPAVPESEAMGRYQNIYFTPTRN